VKYAKAIVGALVAGLSSLQASFDGGVTPQEWTAVALATLSALVVVWAVPNVGA
jgi:hypothetical protein